MTVPKARSDGHLRRYPLRRHRLPVAGGTLSIVAPDAGAWLHAGGYTARAERRDEPPYWADIWPAAVGLARWLCRRPDLGGRRVLDLGCGVGVPGAAATRMGALVTFADREPDALHFARFNALANGGTPERVVTVLHDWHGPVVAGEFDLLCLADVTYRPVHHRPVLRQVEVVAGRGGVAVHVDPFRAEVEGFLVLVRRAFAVQTVATDTFFAGRRAELRLTLIAGSDGAIARWLDAGCVLGRSSGS
jgi:predicted nicotinamide N-methyase